MAKGLEIKNKILNLLPEWMRKSKNRTTMTSYDGSRRLARSTDEDDEFLYSTEDWSRIKPKNRNLI